MYKVQLLRQRNDVDAALALLREAGWKIHRLPVDAAGRVRAGFMGRGRRATNHRDYSFFDS